MPPMWFSDKAPQQAFRVPQVGAVLVSAAAGSIECGLCGNPLSSAEFLKSKPNSLPCVSTDCAPCVSMWRILGSKICPACYGDFRCPRLAGYQSDPPQLGVNPNATVVQQPTLWERRMKTPFGIPRIRTNAVIDIRSDNATMPDPSYQTRIEDDASAAVSNLKGEQGLREALILANKRAGTKFSIQDVTAGIHPSYIQTCTKDQLADSLTHFFTSQTSSGRNQKKRALKPAYRCVSCGRTFHDAAHLRQHVAAHNPKSCTCSVCGKVLSSSHSRRMHERKHRETEFEREERLRKARVAKRELRARRESQHLMGRG